MSESALAYVRGNNAKFYEWLESTRASELIPEGPPVWICGDCHIGNLGPIASAEGHVKIQIRDLDQTVIGNPAHDLIRLSLSLAMAARSSDLPGVTTALMIERILEGYRSGLLNEKSAKPEGEVKPIRLAMKQALHRNWRRLAEERIEDTTPKIPLGKRFWPLTKPERIEIDRVFAAEEARKLITCLKSRRDGDSIEVLDAAYWVKGCSSLGRLRYAVLMGVGKRARHGMCLLDIKEAAAAAAPRVLQMPMPSNDAKRIVEGARVLSPFLGTRMLARTLKGKAVVLRELMPQDLKFEMEALTQRDALAAARLFGSIVGQAHGRQMARDIQNGWLRELKKRRSKTLNAPSWLWSSVVDLASIHESAYLEHCRSYALAPRNASE